MRLWVQTKQWPLAPNLRDSLITRANVSGESHFFQEWPLANVSESGESEQNRLANVNEFSETNPISKRVILASTQICQKWQISGEYSNSINSLSSGHCLVQTQSAETIFVLHSFGSKVPTWYCCMFCYERVNFVDCSPKISSFITKDNKHKTFQMTTTKAQQ
jgi:hypothetical protein